MKGRFTVLTLVLMALLPATVQARYLHMARATRAAHEYVSKVEVPVSGATGGSLGRCWHSGPHVVTCSYTLTGVNVCDYGKSCEVPLTGAPSPSHWFAVIAQRRGSLVGHTLGIGDYDWL